MREKYSILFSTHMLITYLHTPLSRVLLEKQTGFQLVKKFSAFYGTPSFITVITSARHLSLSSARTIQSIPPHHFLKNNLNFILPSTPTPYKCSLALTFPHQNPVYIIPLLHTCYMPAHLILLGLITRKFRKEYISLSSSLCSFLFSLLPRPP